MAATIPDAIYDLVQNNHLSIEYRQHIIEYLQKETMNETEREIFIGVLSDLEISEATRDYLLEKASSNDKISGLKKDIDDLLLDVSRSMEELNGISDICVTTHYQEIREFFLEKYYPEVLSLKDNSIFLVEKYEELLRELSANDLLIKTLGWDQIEFIANSGREPKDFGIAIKQVLEELKDFVPEEKHSWEEQAIEEEAQQKEIKDKKFKIFRRNRKE